MGAVFGRPRQRPLPGQPSTLQLTGQAASEEVDQRTQEGNGGAASSASITGNPSNLPSTGQTAQERVNQSNQEQSPEVPHLGNQEGRAGVQRRDPMEEYEKELNNAWRWACGIGLMHACSQFLAFCNLTFATVVLLGAFVPYLAPLDFDFVLCLLLSEGVRLSSASFFTHLLNRGLAYLSQDPKKIEHSKDDHYSRAKWARNCSRIVQIVFTFPGLIMPGYRVVFSGLDYYEYAPDNPNKVRNVHKSLFIFYVSVSINSLVGLINFVCSPIASSYLEKKFPEEKSILRYFDKVLKNAMSFGVVQADDFDFFDFAFTMLGGEFRRNVQPKAVATNHKQLIHYIYANRLGVDFVQNYMDAEDAFVQRAAVNMVGFWADTAWNVGVPKLRLPEELLTKLADKLGTGQVGWAATTSFGVVAASPQMGPQIVARTCNSRGISVPDRLANLVDDSSSRSLSLVRTLGEFYEKLCKNESNPPEPFKRVDGKLVPKLQKLAREAKVHRLRVQAAYLLRLMDKECNAGVILAIDPSKDDYWFQSEVCMLLLLRRVIKASLVFNPPPRTHKDRDNIDPPRWANDLVPPTQQVGGGNPNPTPWTGATVQPTQEVGAEQVDPPIPAHAIVQPTEEVSPTSKARIQPKGEASPTSGHSSIATFQFEEDIESASHISTGA